MGRVFLEHLGGTRLFNCAQCQTNLTNRNQLISTRFTGATGRAYLFKRVVNLNFSSIQERVMLTGRHMVRDVMCKNCNAKLGWMYEYATDEAQKYLCERTILVVIGEQAVKVKIRSHYQLVFPKKRNHYLRFYAILRYKEGRVILEYALISEIEGFPEIITPVH